jgi:hypothetical protein
MEEVQFYLIQVVKPFNPPLAGRGVETITQASMPRVRGDTFNPPLARRQGCFIP